MEDLKIPEAFPIREGEFVTIPSKSWNSLCKTINDIITAVNAIKDEVGGVSKEVETCKFNISKLAEITEEIYETLE